MQSKGVRRYRPGQAPKWAREEGDEEEVRSGKAAGPPTAKNSGDGRWDVGSKPGATGVDEDRRLRRAAQRHKADGEIEQVEDEEEALRLAARRRRQEAEVVFSASSSAASKEEGRRRRAAVAEVVAAAGPRSEAACAAPRPAEEVEEEEEDEEDSLVERRKRLKEKLREEEEEELANVNNEEGEDDEEDGEEDSSEYESDTSDDEDEGYGSRRPVVAPTFVRKQDRETIRERERKEQEEAMQAQKDEELKERRKAQTRELLVEAIQKERVDAQQHDADADGSSSESEADPEEEDEEAEFEKWKIRELKRIRRDQEEKMGWEKEQQELEKRRGLSDAEIAKLDAEALQPKEKKKWKFLQKYYHKGAFYQDEELVKETDFSEPTLEDRFDRTILPKVMQVKNFGRAGRTKWTHLVDQDTTYLGGGKTNPFARSGEGQPAASVSVPTTTTTTTASSDRWDPWAVAPTLRSKYTQKMGGVGSVDDPLHRKRKRPEGQ